MEEIKVGDKMVRICPSSSSCNLWEIKTCIEISKELYYYEHIRGGRKEYWRKATSEELALGVNNLRDYIRFNPDNFFVKLENPKKDIVKYKELCKKYNLKYTSTWAGQCNIYGVERGKNYSNIWGKKDHLNFYSLLEFESILQTAKVNTSKVEPFDPNNFAVHLKGDKQAFKDYKEFCKMYKLRKHFSWDGGLNYYGVKNGYNWCSFNKKPTTPLYTLRELKKAVIKWATTPKNSLAERFDLESFLVYTGGATENYTRFKNLCIVNGIPLDSNSFENAEYYGIIDGEIIATDTEEITSYSLEEFEELLEYRTSNNNLKVSKNEKSRKIKSKSSRPCKGTAITSVSFRQIAVGSRPIGNKVTVNKSKTKIGSIKICGSVISI